MSSLHCCRVCLGAEMSEAMENSFCCRFGGQEKFLLSHVAGGHTGLEAPDLFRPLKLNSPGRRGLANLLCVVPILSDVPRRNPHRLA